MRSLWNTARTGSRYGYRRVAPRGSLMRRSIAPSSSHSCLSGARSVLRASALASMTLLMPPALVPDRMSITKRTWGALARSSSLISSSFVPESTCASLRYTRAVPRFSAPSVAAGLVARTSCRNSWLMPFM